MMQSVYGGFLEDPEEDEATGDTRVQDTHDLESLEQRQTEDRVCETSAASDSSLLTINVGRVKAATTLT